MQLIFEHLEGAGTVRGVVIVAFGAVVDERIHGIYHHLQKAGGLARAVPYNWDLVDKNVLPKKFGAQ